jgi:hypothetical protein
VSPAAVRPATAQPQAVALTSTVQVLQRVAVLPARRPAMREAAPTWSQVVASLAQPRAVALPEQHSAARTAELTLLPVAEAAAAAQTSSRAVAAEVVQPSVAVTPVAAVPTEASAGARSSAAAQPEAAPLSAAAGSMAAVRPAGVLVAAPRARAAAPQAVAVAQVVAAAGVQPEAEAVAVPDAAPAAGAELPREAAVRDAAPVVEAEPLREAAVRDVAALRRVALRQVAQPLVAVSAPASFVPEDPSHRQPPTVPARRRCCALPRGQQPASARRWTWRSSPTTGIEVWSWMSLAPATFNNVLHACLFRDDLHAFLSAPALKAGIRRGRC